MRNYDANDNESYSFDIGYSSLSTSMMTYGGHRFLGVFNTPDGTGTQYFDANGRLMEGIVLGENDKLYMCWSEVTYTVELYLESEKISTEQLNYGNDMERIFSDIQYMVEFFDAPAGQEFKGWEIRTSTGFTLVTDKHGKVREGYETLSSAYNPGNSETIRIYARFGKISYTVTLHYEDGYTDTFEVEHGDTLADRLPTPDKLANMEFKGWSRTNSVENPQFYNNEPITEDIELYAIYTKYRDITVIFEGHEIGFVRVSNDAPVNLSTYLSEHSEDFTLSAGYEISNWYMDADHYNGIAQVNYDDECKTLYVLLRPIQYRLTLSRPAGVMCPNTYFDYTVETPAEQRTLPVASKTNYEFVGWCTDEGCTNEPWLSVPEDLTGDLTLYPKFKGKAITFTLNEQNGKTEYTIEREYGIQNYSLPVPVYAGHVFLGWFDSRTGGNQITNAEGESLEPLDFTEDKALWAHWATQHTVNYSVTPSPDICKVEGVQPYYLDGDQVELSFEMPVGYTFNGWFVDGVNKQSTGTKYTFTMGDEDVHIEIRFTAKTYNVKFKEDADIQLDTTQKTVTYGQEFEFPVPTVKEENNSFKGWSYNGKLITDDKGKGRSAWNIDEDNITVEALVIEESPDGSTISVYSVETLQNMSKDPSKTYVIKCDIEMEGEKWEPFAFSGTLDGGNHTISGLTIENNNTKKWLTVGMFTVVTGTIKNVKFTDLNVTSNYNDYSLNYYEVGGVCGKLSNKGTLTGVTIESGKIDGVNARYCVGGLVGVMESGCKIESCENHAEVISRSDKGAGGIVAWSSSANITDCTNYGNISGTNCVGGIAGYVEFTNVAGSLTGLINEGVIAGKDHVGGIFGELKNNIRADLTLGNLKNSKGAVNGANRVGGIIGYFNIIYNKLVATDLVNSVDITGTSKVGGLVGEGESASTDSAITGNSSGTITSGYYIGGIAGRLVKVQLRGCSNNGTTIVANGSMSGQDGQREGYVGGYVGEGYSVSGCTNTVAINYTQRGAYVGGIAGRANGVITDCTNSARIDAPSSDCVGGIAGDIELTTGGITVSGLKNQAEVTGKSNVAGICGKFQNVVNGQLTMVFGGLTNNGKVTATGSYIGGIIGYLHATVKLTASEDIKNQADIKGASYVGGIFGYADTNNVNSILTASSSGTITATEWVIGGIAGQVENIKLSNCSNESTKINATGNHSNSGTYESYVGGYVGRGYAFENCINNSAITYTQRGAYIGGIAGFANGVITECTNSAKIDAKLCDYVGGIVGDVGLAAGGITVSGLNNTGVVVGNGNVGGICGYFQNVVQSGQLAMVLADLENSGAVTATGSYVGGIIGRLHVNSNSGFKITATDKIVNNQADISGASHVGGIFGYADANDTASILTASSSGTITATEWVIGGIAGQVDNIKLSNCSNAGTTIKITGHHTNNNGEYESYVGGYAGKGYAFEDCTNNSTINYTLDGKYIGGIVGFATGAILRSTNNGAIAASNGDYVGGIAGYIQLEGTTFILGGLKNTGAVTGRGRVGGIAGEIYAHTNAYGDSSISLQDFENSRGGTVQGNNYVGGLIGYLHVYSERANYVIAATNMKNAANVSGRGATQTLPLQFIGGLIGKLESDGSSKITGYEQTGTVTPTNNDTCKNLIGSQPDDLVLSKN